MGLWMRILLKLLLTVRLVSDLNLKLPLFSTLLHSFLYSAAFPLLVV